MTEQLDRKDLKVLAYRNKVAEQEEAINELRVDFTILSEQLKQTVAELDKYRAKYGDLEQEESGESSETEDAD